MMDTHFYLRTDKAGRLAVVYRRAPDAPLERSPASGGTRGQGLYVDGPRASFSDGAGLLSTAHDYGRFLQAILDGRVRGHHGVVRSTLKRGAGVGTISGSTHPCLRFPTTHSQSHGVLQ